MVDFETIFYLENIKITVEIWSHFIICNILVCLEIILELILILISYIYNKKIG